jgi:hypothetical protein
MMKFFWFRKVHRFFALTICIPLLLTLITGMLITVVQEWSLKIGVESSLLLRIHTGAIFNLQGFYPILNGLGLMALIASGLSISGIFRKGRE